MSDHQPMIRRNAFEREVTREAAHTVGVDATSLIEFAELRAGAGEVRDIDTRNFGHEVLEELADARNYACWWMEQIIRGASDQEEIAGELSATVAQALAATTLAFHHAHRAQALMADWQRGAAA